MQGPELVVLVPSLELGVQVKMLIYNYTLYPIILLELGVLETMPI